MRYTAFVMWLVCRNTHKRFFVSIFAFLLLTIKTIKLDGDSFSVDIFEDYAKANKKMSKDKFFKLYK